MQNFQIPGIDSEVCSCRHCHWGSIDALLAEEQDMVIVQYEGNWALLQHQRRTDVEKNQVDSGSRRCFGDLYPVSAHSSEYLSCPLLLPIS